MSQHALKNHWCRLPPSLHLHTQQPHQAFVTQSAAWAQVQDPARHLVHAAAAAAAFWLAAAAAADEPHSF